MCPPRKGSGRCPSRSRRREAGSSARADPCGAPLPTVVAAAADGDGYGCQPPCGLHAVGAVRESPPAGETPSARCGVAEEKRMEIERGRGACRSAERQQGEETPGVVWTLHVGEWVRNERPAVLEK